MTTMQVFEPNDKIPSPRVHAFYHKPSSTCTFVVEDPQSKKAAIIDSALDYGLHSGKIGTEFIDSIISAIDKEGLRVEWILETHVHTDHLTASAYLKQRWPWAKTAISEHITEVQQYWSHKLELTDFDCTGSQWDFLISPSRNEIELGFLTIKAVDTPGHTPACLTYVVGDCLFVGDAIFQPDFGTARCDFPGGSPHALYDSIRSTLYSFPDNFRIFVGHDYPPTDRSVIFNTDIASQKKYNKFLTEETSKPDFVAARLARDSRLDSPNLLYPAMQININAGRLPPDSGKGERFIKTPLSLASHITPF